MYVDSLMCNLCMQLLLSVILFIFFCMICFVNTAIILLLCGMWVSYFERVLLITIIRHLLMPFIYYLIMELMIYNTN
jgi:hypothetical protein